MTDDLVGNVLIIQHGCNSGVSNAVLSGIITEALNYENVEEVFGSINGIQGILNENFIDLAAESQQTIRDLQFTPGAFLGTCEWSDRAESEFGKIFEILEKRGIRYLFFIGGNEAQEMAHEFTKWSTEKNYEIRIISVPETAQNNIPITDHCLGYGSAVKQIATHIKELSLYGETTGNHDSVIILEIPDSHEGWITAGASIAKYRASMQAESYYFLLPQLEYSEEMILDKIQNILKLKKFCLIVLPENLMDLNGNPLNDKDFGMAQKLHSIIKETLEVKVSVVKFGPLQCLSSVLLAKTDVQEAVKCASKAVSFAMDGVSGKMVTLLRASTTSYSAEYGLADLANVVGHTKLFHSSWVNEQGEIDNSFYKYLLPLLQGEVDVIYENGLPHFSSSSKA